YSDGTILFRNNYSGYKGKTAIMKIKTNTKYTVKIHDEDLSNILRIALNENVPVFASDDEPDQIADISVFSNSAGDPEKEYTFTTGNESRYLVVYVSNNGNEPRMQVEEGGSASGYVEGPKFKKSFINLHVNPGDTSFFTESKNLFNGYYYDGMLTRVG